MLWITYFLHRSSTFRCVCVCVLAAPKRYTAPVYWNGCVLSFAGCHFYFDKGKLNFCIPFFFHALFHITNDHLQVSWIRHRDIHILTVGTYTYTTDQRFQTAFHRDLNEWTLQIKWAQKRDAGLYECQISTIPIKSYPVRLNVVGKCEIHDSIWCFHFFSLFQIGILCVNLDVNRKFPIDFPQSGWIVSPI